MPLPLLLVLQAATTAIGPPAGTGFDLRSAPPAVVCQPAAGDEIVVCAARDDDTQFRLRPLRSEKYDPKPLIASIPLFGSATGSLHGDSVALPGGNVSKRVMVTIKVPF